MNPPVARNAPDLGTVVLDVLGELAFMVTDDTPPPLPAGTVYLQAEIEYRGPLHGRLRCWCTRGFAQRLAANLLGIEPGQAEAQLAAEDAVREFMNVLCGQLVTLWHGADPVFNLTIPTVCECLAAPAELGAEPRHSALLSIEGEPLLFRYDPQPGRA